MSATERVTLTQVALASARVSAFRSGCVCAGRQMLLVLRNKLTNGHLGRAKELAIHVLNLLLLAARAIRFALVAGDFLATAIRKIENRSWHYISLSNSN